MTEDEMVSRLTRKRGRWALDLPRGEFLFDQHITKKEAERAIRAAYTLHIAKYN
jgi:hypothetical protein